MKTKKTTVLVTGGAGYIGSHVVRMLLDNNYQCLVLDNMTTGHRSAVDTRATLFNVDLKDSTAVTQILTDQSPQAVLHFAASIVVPESVTDPITYYRNNSLNTLNLLDTCIQLGITEFLFSSTAAVYGTSSSKTLVTEQDVATPINPYGSSKMMSEQFLADLAAIDALRYVSMRYFNVAGAHPDGSIGQTTANATHLIKVACETALKKRTHIDIYGTDYPTTDGTCIRDYIHVQDLAHAHILALEYLLEGGKSTVFNCGYGHGSSVREVIRTTQSVSKYDFPVQEKERRAGDLAQLVADSRKLRSQLAWQPQYDDLPTIITHALNWEKKTQQ